MSIDFGPVPIGAVLPVFFPTYGKTNGESITMTGLAVTDIEIYKGTSTTQRASDAGYTLLDTDGIDFDGITGIHGFSIDTGDNTDAGFYAAGSYYTVIVSAVTVDSQTVNFIAATFRCVTAEGVAGQPKVDTAAIAGTAVNTSSAQLGVNVVNAAGTAWGSGAITAASIAADAITAAKIATDAIDADAIADNAINAGAIATGAITAAKFAAGAIDAAAIADGAIDAATFAASAITATVIAADAITAAKIAAGALDGPTFTASVGSFTIGSGSTTTSIVMSSITPASAVNSQFNGRIMIFDNATTTAALRGQATDITAWVHATTTATVTALTTAPASGDTGHIL